MLTRVTSVIHNARERARCRRDYRSLLDQSDAMLRDIGVERSRLYRAVVLGKSD
jgi:uncharacterized protein YjiS (DUF1127 family)